jgi:phosphatidylglycerol:prolipoprotein diacylglycerol transferase
VHPVLFRIGPFTLHTYGVFIAAAFFLAIGMSLREARKQGMDQNRILDLAFYLTLSGVLGARTLFIIVEYEYFLEDPIRIFKIWEGGLVFYGGLIVAFIVSAFYVRKHKLPVLKIADFVAPALSAAQALGRMGCLTAGCCYGKETSRPWGIVFTDPESLVPLEKLHVTLHPTQIYSSLSNLTLFVLLYMLYRNRKFDGQVCFMYGMLYPLVRSFLEFFRGDARGGILGGMVSTSQLISLGVFAVALSFYLTFRKRAYAQKG